MNVLADFVADIAEERIVDEIVDYGVLVAMGSISIFSSRRWRLAHTAANRRIRSYRSQVLCCRRDRRGNSYAPRHRR